MDADAGRDFAEFGVVCRRAAFDAAWVERLRGAVERDLADPGPHATNFAEGSSAGRFFGDMFMWQRDRDFRAAALESPAARIAAETMGADAVDFFYDQLFVKEPGTAHPTPWHQDQPYWPVRGLQVATVWIALDPVDRENGAVEFVAGSHRWGTNFRPTPFKRDHAAKFTDSPLPVVPDIDARRGDYDIRSWDMAPGDCLVFHGLILHGAPGNATAGRRRRGLSLRYTGPDARYDPRPGTFQFPHTPDLAPGAPMRCALFPRAWSKL
ncbi:MAG: phytanoyl-CoA dioxygenase family protein [Alphaproteobacteria bacterium]|nr:phytanoyl-CoA dioxygenase family protein [Alphaproteobacteria bacterium]